MISLGNNNCFIQCFPLPTHKVHEQKIWEYVYMDRKMCVASFGNTKMIQDNHKTLPYHLKDLQKWPLTILKCSSMIFTATF